MLATKGKLIYNIYRAVSHGLSPLLYLHLHWRKLRGLEHPLRWPERLGRPSLPRPPGPLLWLHAVSLGEGMSAIPVIKECIQKRPDLTILMTTTTFSAFEVINKRLPASVIHQIMLALLNARISTKSFKRWSGPVLLPLISLMLSKFSLIAPLSTTQAIHFQLLHAPPFVINFSGDLKCVVEDFDNCEGEMRSTEGLTSQLSHRQVWMASSIHKGEEEVILSIHKVLTQEYPNLFTIIVPRHPQHGKDIAQKLWREGHGVALRSQHQKLVGETNILVVDTLGELRHMYRLTPIAVIGGSFFPSFSGHNISEAAAAGCAILTGPHVGHFSSMVLEMQRLNSLSVLQVSAGLELEEALRKLLSDAKILEEHRVAAKQVYHALSEGILGNVWHLLDFHILTRFELKRK
ncbi:probable 3-deoxy-D-manno-octulosonic acid transferase, mitochondrial isoform X2 [Argentina anserina]|uniref:probable 3-deoxy-D-manno-octulosonic acid transferase, mitochondrial isoform X2 n=1 Tax=Argentina anserina TaxID=57926 RepID=UPI002176445B|nr:probable 3-deoxy-D-manno-octulosonic acid transferase, mitochondrial isoform X2 [Potentilla anserina]